MTAFYQFLSITLVKSYYLRRESRFAFDRKNKTKIILIFEMIWKLLRILIEI